MKYAHIDENGKLLGWYDDEIHQNIPTQSVKVTDEEWYEAISVNANCYQDGKFIVKDFRTQEEVAQQELDKKIQEAKAYLARTDFKMTVDYYVTLSEAEQLELTSKRAEAREYIRLNEVQA